MQAHKCTISEQGERMIRIVGFKEYLILKAIHNVIILKANDTTATVYITKKR